MNKKIDPETFSMKKFVKYVNANWHKNPEKYGDIVKKYLERTIKDGVMFVVRTPSIKERILEKSNNKILGIMALESVYDFQELLMFKNGYYQEMAKPYVMDFVLNGYMQNYYFGTVPCKMREGEEFYQTNSPQLAGEDMLALTKFILQNPEMFNKQDVQNFTNKFVETCFLRKQKNSALPSPYKKDISPYFYDRMEGLYYFEEEALYEMAKGLAERGLPLDNIKRALSLEFDEDLGQEGYIPLEKQANLFYAFKEMATCVIENPKKFCRMEQQLGLGE